MRVLLANSLYPPYSLGGAEVSVRDLATGLAARGCEVDVVATAPTASTDTHDGVRITYLAGLNLFWPFDKHHRSAPMRKLWHAIDIYNPRTVRALAWLLADNPPDVVHTHNLQGLSVSVWKAARNAHLPVVHTTRDYYLTCGRATRWRGRNCTRTCADCLPLCAARRRASSLVDRAIGVSQSIADQHTALGFFPGAPEPDVITTAVSGRGTPASRVPDSDPPVFGYLGRLEPYKGIELLLRSFAERRASDARLLLAGTGPDDYVAKLRQMVAARPEGIEFVGSTSSEELLARIHVLVVPSLWHEPLSRSALEGRAHGIPVIAARRGGLPEVIEDRHSGLLFEPDSPTGLSEAIDRLAADPELRHRLGNNGRQQAQRHHQEAVVREHIDVYEAVLAR